MRGSKKKGNNSLYFKVFVCFFIISFLVCLGRSFVAKIIVETIITKDLGVKISVTKVDINLMRKELILKDLLIDNPSGFAGTFAKISSAKIYPDPYSWLKFAPRYRQVELNFSEISIVKKWNQELNTNIIKAIASKKSASKQRRNNTFIDVMVFSVDSVKYLDYSEKEPVIRKIRLGLNQEKIYGVRSLNDFVQALIDKVNFKVGISSI